ncbi:MAG: hypothetical protein AVDCRST_MAG59-4510, partial [uncultured Thermomicrobiales bacterium]
DPLSRMVVSSRRVPGQPGPGSGPRMRCSFAGTGSRVAGGERQARV